MRFATLSVILALSATGTSKAVAPALSHSIDTENTRTAFKRNGMLDQRSDWPFTPGPETAGLDFDIKKYADDEMWKRYIDKGERWNCLMAATDAGAGFLIEDTRKPPSAASPWQGDLQGPLATWGWHERDYDKGWECDFERMRLGAAFNGLGLNAKPKYEDDGDPGEGDNDCFSITHYDEEDVTDPDADWPEMKPVKEQKYKVKEREYMMTGAYYEFAINQKGGAIIGRNLLSPATAVVDSANWGRKAAKEELPEIRFASDIFLAYWIRGNPNIRNLRVYGAENIVNDDTVLLVARAFKNNELTKLAPWPGNSFDASTSEGKALIGSPIGTSIARLLASRKAELGIKHITKAIVVTNEAPKKPKFGERPRQDLHIFFQIADVPTEEITKPDEEKPEEKSGEKRSGHTGGLTYTQKSERGNVRVHNFSY